MSWQAVDSVSQAKPGGVTEDLAGTEGPVAWILDGASAVTDDHLAHGHPSDACWLVERLDRALRDLAGSGADLERLVAQAIASVAEAATKEWDRRPDVPPSAALGVVRRDGDGVECSVLADVSVVVRTPRGVAEVCDRRVDHTSAPVLAAMAGHLTGGVPYEQVLTEIRPLLAAHRQVHMNTDGGYWVASLDESAASRSLRRSYRGVDEVVLATDGFMRALRPFGLLPGLAALFEPDLRLADVADQIRSAELADPDTRRFPRWSRHDDLLAIRLRWE